MLGRYIPSGQRVWQHCNKNLPMNQDSSFPSRQDAQQPTTGAIKNICYFRESELTTGSGLRAAERTRRPLHETPPLQTPGGRMKINQTKKREKKTKVVLVVTREGEERRDRAPTRIRERGETFESQGESRRNYKQQQGKRDSGQRWLWKGHRLELSSSEHNSIVRGPLQRRLVFSVYCGATDLCVLCSEALSRVFILLPSRKSAKTKGCENFERRNACALLLIDLFSVILLSVFIP